MLRVEMRRTGYTRQRRTPWSLDRMMLVSCLCLSVCARARARGVREAGWAGVAFGPQQSVPPGAKTGGTTVRGVVTDDDGAAVPGAEVTLESAGGEQKTTAGADGTYQFLGVAAGSFHVTATASGFAPEGASGGARAGETAEVPPIELPVATMTDQVDVTLTRHDIAEEEMKVEETQRVLGFLPNFYVAYNWRAAPMSAGEKFRLAFRTLYDPVTVVVTGITAGAEQATETFPGYGQGARGYFKRYGAAYADQATGDLIGGALLPVLLRQDPRYFYKGTGTVRTRVLYALAAAFVCRGDNGKWQPNYSSVLGDLAAGALSNTYYPAAQRSGARLTIDNGLLGAAEDGIGNLVQEFVFKHVTPHSPDYAPAPLGNPFRRVSAGPSVAAAGASGAPEAAAPAPAPAH